MIIRREPNKCIQHLIDLIWYMEAKELDENLKQDTVVPTGHVHLVYNLGDACSINDDGKQIRIPDKVLIGQFQSASQISYGKSVKQMGIAIKPYALFPLFNLISGLFTETMVDCSEIASIKPLNEEVQKLAMDHTISGSQFLEKTEAFLNRYAHVDFDFEVYERMTAYIEERSGMIEVKCMAKTFGYSVSTLERKFKKVMGLTPKAYADILRFRKAIQIQSPTKLFYDQSHFIRYCKKYTDKNPSDLHIVEALSLKYMLGIDE